MKLKTLTVATCYEGKKSQKWKWGFVNETMLRNWMEFGKPIKDEVELEYFRQLSEENVIDE